MVSSIIGENCIKRMKIMKRITAFFLASMMSFLALLSCGCDQRGRLTERETQRLYDEFSGLIRSGEIWEYKADTWLSNDWSSEKEKETTVKYLRIVAEKAFDPENPVVTSGTWFSNKKYCQTIHIMWQGSLLPDDEREGIRTLFSATKYDSGRILLDWSDIEPGSDTWRTILEAQFNKE